MFSEKRRNMKLSGYIKEDKATYMAHVKNMTGKIYFDVFKNAVIKKRAQAITHESTPKPEANQDITKALYIFNNIFRDGLDMDKVGKDIKTLLETKTPNGSSLFYQQRHWYIVYLWFFEIGFIVKNDFSEAKKIYKDEFPSQWKPIVDHHDYTDIRDWLANVFSKENRKEYVIKDRYIAW